MIQLLPVFHLPNIQHLASGHDIFQILSNLRPSTAKLCLLLLSAALVWLVNMLFIKPMSDPLRHLPGPTAPLLQSHLQQFLEWAAFSPVFSPFSFLHLYFKAPCWAPLLTKVGEKPLARPSASTASEEYVHPSSIFSRFLMFCPQHDLRLISFDHTANKHVLNSEMFERPWQTRSFLGRLVGHGIVMIPPRIQPLCWPISTRCFLRGRQRTLKATSCPEFCPYASVAQLYDPNILQQGWRVMWEVDWHFKSTKGRPILRANVLGSCFWCCQLDVSNVFWYHGFNNTQARISLPSRRNWTFLSRVPSNVQHRGQRIDLERNTGSPFPNSKKDLGECVCLSNHSN